LHRHHLKKYFKNRSLKSYLAITYIFFLFSTNLNILSISIRIFYQIQTKDVIFCRNKQGSCLNIFAHIEDISKRINKRTDENERKPHEHSVGLFLK